MNPNKVSYRLVVMVIMSLLLIGCSGNKPVVDSNSEKGERTNLLTSKDKENEQEAVGDKVKDRWTDIDGLIEVFKGEDFYYIYYDEDKWNEKYDFEDIVKTEYLNGKFADRKLQIWGLDEGIKEVSIVSIDGYGGSHALKNDYPIVFMLMESGRVVWMHGYPAVDEVLDNGEEFKKDEQYIYGYLPYIKDIVGFVYESDGEGIGTKTLFAVDNNGLRYDTRNLIDYELLLYGNWITAPAYSYGGEFDYIYLNFVEDGSARMYRLKDNRTIELYYEGKYDMHLDDTSSKESPSTV